MLALAVAILLIPFAALTGADWLIETTDPQQLKDMGIMLHPSQRADGLYTR